MSLAIVRQHLLTTFRGVAGDMPVVPEGENFQPEGLQDYPWARFAILPVESQIRGLSTDQTLRGLAAITLYFTRTTNNVTDALVLAEMVRENFPIQNTVLVGGTQMLVTASWVEAVRHDEDGFFVPIFVRWTYFD